ncbi:MAG: YlbF family regulator [Acholeplasmataceae bacterium]
MTEKEKLLELLKSDEQIKRYKQIEKVMNNDIKIKTKINQLKTIQKQLINAKEIQKTQAIKKFQLAYDILLQEIESYPLMAEYLELQDVINHMLKEVVQIIEDKINKEVENT